MYHSVSAILAATISINTIELCTMGREEWMQKVCDLPVEDANFSPSVNILSDNAEATNKAGIWASYTLKEQYHWKNLV
jgi:hypothetical protein